MVNISIDPSSAIGTNRLTLGANMDHYRWSLFIQHQILRDHGENANIKIFRVFEAARANSPNPCKNWPNTWDWTETDELTRRIFEVGAEPLFCFGYVPMERSVPPGMSVIDGLPDANTYASYTSEWVRHFKNVGLSVRYYEIVNEPHHFFGVNASDSAKFQRYLQFYNTVVRAMRAENSNLMISQDAMIQQRVFDTWLTQGEDIDFIDFHKYDGQAVGQYDDARMFQRAQTYLFDSGTTPVPHYGIQDARQRWLQQRNVVLPAICGECNMVEAWNPTDPRTQQMAGAVWLSLVVKGGIQKGLDNLTYFEFTAPEQDSYFGFGMISERDGHPWYPYYVFRMVGPNLGVGDTTLYSFSSSPSQVETLAWIHDNKLIILLVCLVHTDTPVTIQGVSGNFNAEWIDETISYLNPTLQSGTVGTSLVLQGYTVALLQQPLSTYNLSIKSSPTLSVPITIDGVFVGNMPQTVPLAEGEHNISIPEDVEL